MIPECLHFGTKCAASVSMDCLWAGETLFVIDVYIGNIAPIRVPREGFGAQGPSTDGHESLVYAGCQTEEGAT